MDIRLLPQQDIDKIKWNSCVHYANNGNIFGYMWYLNNTAKSWDALVEGDYETVLPIIWKEKSFPRSKHFYQPDLIRETGPYSIHALSRKRVRLMLEAIPEEYQQINIQLSEQISPPTDLGYDIVEKYNYQLLLAETYKQISDGYSAGFFRQLEKAQNARLLPISNLKPEKIAEFYRQHAPRGSFKEANYHAYLRIMYNALHRGWGFASGIQDRQNNLLCVNFFVFSHGKMMRLLSGQSAEAQQLGAMSYAYDLIIRNNAGRPMILDLNSWHDEELGRSLGAQQNIYYQIQKDKSTWKVKNPFKR